jgi:hypothetical protein
VRPSYLLLIVILLLPFTVAAQINPAFFIRIKNCNNVQASLFMQGNEILKGSCESLQRKTIYLNDYFIANGNKLSFDIVNENANNFYGVLSYELLVQDGSNMLKTIFNEILETKDGSKFSISLDNRLKKYNWSIDFKNSSAEKIDTFLASSEEKVDKHAFAKNEKYYLMITPSNNAVFSVFANDSLITQRSHWSESAQKPIFLNAMSRTKKAMLLRYKIEPTEGTVSPSLQITLMYYPPSSGEGEVLFETTIQCTQNELIKTGTLDVTDQLRSKGFFYIIK